MPTYLDFESSRNGNNIPDSKQGFRDFLINKTLKRLNGPQTFTAQNYLESTQNEYSNIEQAKIENLRNPELEQSQNKNVFKPTEYVIFENLETIPRKANLNLYPYFVTNLNHNLVSLYTTENYDNESELLKFAAYNIKKNVDGPLLSRFKQNLYTSTLGRARIIDALQGNTATAINLITGKEPLIEKNFKITVQKNLLGKGINFLQTVSGVEFPFSTIPGDYLSNPSNPVNYRPEAKTELGKIFRDTTGVLGSLIGIKRTPKQDTKPSDLLIDYMGQGQRQELYHNLSFSKYKPNYTTTARSQNSSKIFNFIDKTGQGINRLLGLEAPTGLAYIGDDRGDNVKFAMGDFNDRTVRSPFYLSLKFDETQTRLFQNEKNISENGSIAGNLTWYTKKSVNKLGEHNQEYNSEKSRFEQSLSTNFDFSRGGAGSILSSTQELLETLPQTGGDARSHVANAIDQTTRIFKEGDIFISRGSAIRYSSATIGEGTEYCRVWTKDRSYMNYSDTMKKTGLIRKVQDSVISTPWNLNIYPNSNGNGSFGTDSTNIQNGVAKKYMFSIENLVWKNSNKDGYKYDDLPYCERGSNGGRVMWFAPYGLKVSEQNNAKWSSNDFLGRPEPIYTYQNTERGGSISFKIVVDHPSILNLLIKDIPDDEAENYINSFFAGCEDIDFYSLVRKYTTLDPSDLKLIQSYIDYYKPGGKTVDTTTKLIFNNTLGEPTTTPNVSVDEANPSTSYTNGDGFNDFLYYPNASPGDKNSLYSNTTYDQIYNVYINDQQTFINKLENKLPILLNKNSDEAKNDKHIIFGSIDPTYNGDTSTALITKQVSEIQNGFEKLSLNFTTLNEKIATLKDLINKNSADSIGIVIVSSASYLADVDYNVKLSYRRSHSIVSYILKQLSKNGDYVYNKKWDWEYSVDNNTAKIPTSESDKEVSLKELGYGDDNNKTINIKFANFGEETSSGGEVYKCTGYNILSDNDLKLYTPITFFCRASKVSLIYKKISTDPTKKGSETPTVTTFGQPKTIVELPIDEKPKKPPIDVVKKIIMKTLSECFYFKKLEETDPVVFGTLKEKLKYFSPAFHSTTPEGLNSRLTFLQQCLRPGDTIPIKNPTADISKNQLDARNTTFGPPPVCVLRIGDFYNSKVIINNMNIEYDETTWDLNPEGIGLQPMIANVTLQVYFIGGQGIKEPVAKLQNALSSNFYANTEVYDYRAEATSDLTEEMKKFNVDFLESLINQIKQEKQATNETSPDEKINDKFIGSFVDNTKLSYEKNMEDLITKTNNYFELFDKSYNEITKTYGSNILPLFISPTYRTIKSLDVQNTNSGVITLDILGDYQKTLDFSVLFNRFEKVILGKTNIVDYVQLLGLNVKAGTTYNRTNNILRPFITDLLKTFLTSIRDDKTTINLVKARNEIINKIDELNFIMSSDGKDGKLITTGSTGVELVDFNSSEFYSKYNSAITLIQEKHSLFTSDLDNSIDFKSTTISDDAFKSLVAIVLNNKINELIQAFKNNENKNLFNDNFIYDFGKTLLKFVEANSFYNVSSNKDSTGLITYNSKSKYKDKKFKYNKVKLKNKPTPYGTTSTTLTTQQTETLTKINNKKSFATTTKLNFSR